MLVVQSTVTTARHISRSYRGLIFSELIENIDVPVVVGNCVGYSTALELMETGISGLLVGVGPGAACTTREVVGVGVPQVTASMDCAAAREEYFNRTGKRVTVITDGGIRTGGDLCKALAAGADGVMLGHPLCTGAGSPRRRIQLGHGQSPSGTASRYPHQCGHQGNAEGDPLRADLSHRRHTEPDGGFEGCPGHVLEP